MTDIMMVQTEQQTELMKGSEYAIQHTLPKWQYIGPPPEAHNRLAGEDVFTLPALDGPTVMDLGNYSRALVTNCNDVTGRRYFDLGLRLMLSYQHELAAKCFLACLGICPHCALAHGLLALSHSPNYNFKGEAYYMSACHDEDVAKHDLLCVFPSQHVAERHGRMAVEKVEAIRKLHRKKKGKKNTNNKKGGGRKNKNNNNNNNKNNNNNNNNNEPAEALPDMISDVEAQFLAAVRILTSTPGVDPDLSDETVGRPYAEALGKVYDKYSTDPEICYFYAEALMVLNAWQLYEYPSGKPVSPDVLESRAVLERALKLHPEHAGLCHMYVHLSEMSAHPEMALRACQSLRGLFPHAGHLIHMATHIDVLVGDYENCIKYNFKAREADLHVMKVSPASAGTESFYFGYIVHNYHMGVYGAILGGMEKEGMRMAEELNTMVNETMFEEFPDLVAYLETYAALEIHVMVRFGRWDEILRVPMPKDKQLMMYRTASILYARALAYAMKGNITEAMKEADRFDTLRKHPEAELRILHNNTVADLLALDAVMMRGEIAYKSGKHKQGLDLLRRAVEMQDNLNYDEPWGKMQPVRHALGGLLLEQGIVDEAIDVFRTDLKYHPKNPWALVGLISALKKKTVGSCCCAPPDPTETNGNDILCEIAELEDQFNKQRELEFSDFDLVVPCECCQRG